MSKFKGGIQSVNWFRDHQPEPQADGDPSETFAERVTRESHHGAAGTPPTTREPYPQMSFVEKEELLVLLKAKVMMLERSVDNILKLLEQSK